MSRLSFRLSSALTLAAALSMAATSANAAPLDLHGSASAGAPISAAWDRDDTVVHQYRGWGGGYGGWGRHRHYRGNGISTGDVLAGVLIIGGIAAIASAASKNSRDRAEERSYPDDRNDTYPNRDDRQDYRDRDDRDGRDSSYSDSRGLDRAAEMCVNEVERSQQVEDVSTVNRDGDGWHVEGRLRNGKDFSCEIDNNGTVRNMDLDRGVAAGPDNQRDDDYYARARERQGDVPYPGGA